MTSLPYVIVVSDGVSIRTLHPPALGRHREAIENAISRVLHPERWEAAEQALADMQRKGHGAGAPGNQPRAPAPAREGEILPPVRRPTPPTVSPTMTQGEIAAASGYTGNVCQSCGGFAMVRTGTCETCQSCAATSGGCS